MQKLFSKLFPTQIRWKGVAIEAVIFVTVYLLWMIFNSPASPSRALIGSLAILSPLLAAIFFIYWSRALIPEYSRRAWFFLGVALACLTIGNFIRTIYLTILEITLPVLSLADIFNLLSFPFFLYALTLIPFENRYAPSRFRFFLDVTISSGVVATLGWLILAPTLVLSGINGLEGLVPLAYPIFDLILLMIVINLLLANRKARRTSLIWGIALVTVLISDYYYSYEVSLQGYQAGDPGSLGWVIGYLLFGLSVLIETNLPPREPPKETSAIDLGARLQNLLPLALELGLFWYVLVDRQYRGQVSVLGLSMCLLFAMGLIVRMGLRAGESELHQYWQLFSSLAEPTFICDDHGRILLGNPALIRAVGMNEENQIIGKPIELIFDFSHVPSDLLKRASQQDVSREVILKVQSAPYLLALSPIASETRKSLIAGVAHDLSEQKHQQEAIQKAYEELQVVYRRLEELNSQLEQKVDERTRTLSEANLQLEEQNQILQALDQLKSDFVSLVSHELRTPLTSLTGGLELLLNRRNRNQSDQTTLLLMKNEAERLTRFVENILNLSAMEAGRLELHPVPLSLPRLLEQVRDKLSQLPGAERIQLRVPQRLPKIIADESVLQSIFNHLIDNALKYATEGPVVIDAYRDRNRIRVQVTDHGPGIPKEKRRLLFKRFQRLDAKDSQSVYGYGLGLYLSRQMLQAMSSDLSYETPEEGGARFYFYLKAVQ